MALANSFDNGTVGVEITVANSGTSGDAFVAVTHDCYYDNAQTFLGAAVARIDALEGGQLKWTLSATPRSAFLRAAVFIPTGFGIASGYAEFTTAINTFIGGGPLLQVVYDSGGSPPLLLQLQMTTNVIFTTVPPRNAWFRLELAWQDGPVEGRLALDPYGIHDEAQTLTETGGFDMNYARVGGCCDVGDDVYIDQLGVSQTDWLGPYTGGGGDPPLLGGRRKTRPPRNPRRYYV